MSSIRTEEGCLHKQQAWDTRIRIVRELTWVAVGAAPSSGAGAGPLDAAAAVAADDVATESVATALAPEARRTRAHLRTHARALAATLGALSWQSNNYNTFSIRPPLIEKNVDVLKIFFRLTRRIISAGGIQERRRERKWCVFRNR